MCAKLWQWVCGAVFLAAATLWATAAVSPAANSPASTDGAPFVDLPADPAAWINSGALNLAVLDGKGAVLWFFEETCPKCRGKWPALLDFAKSYEGQPVVFIAVNSGTPRGAIEQYVKECRVDWPVLLDPSREFERLADVGEISLQNIHQASVLTPDGKLVRARWSDLEGAVQLALQGAKWTIDPQEIPASLAPAFKAVCLGKYSTAAAALKKARESTDPTSKQAAHRIDGMVQKKIAVAAGDAQTALDGGDKYSALQRLTEIAKRFQGFDLPPEMAKQRQELVRDPQVKAATKAAKDIETVKRMMSTAGANPATRNRAETMLKQAAKDAADTQVGKEAEALLAQMGVSVSSQ